MNVITTETEICCFSLESALTAHKLSVDRVELCGGFLEGGTTPSHGLIELVLEKISPKTYVMIRPRGGDFCYSETEVLTIDKEISLIKKLNPGGFVFGALNLAGEIDITLCKKVISLAKPYPVTFHRAFDQCANPLKALEEIIEMGFERILTSGQKNTAIEGLDLIMELQELAKGRIQIMAGSGVNSENVGEFVKAGIDAVHFTGKGWIQSQSSGSSVSMLSENLPNSLGKYETSFSKGKAILDVIAYSKKM